MSAVLDRRELDRQRKRQPQGQEWEQEPTLTFFDLVAAVSEVAEDDAETIALLSDLVRRGRVRVADMPLLVLPAMILTRVRQR